MRQFTYETTVPFAGAVVEEPQPLEAALNTAGGSKLRLERAENQLDLYVTFQMQATSQAGALGKGNGVLRSFFPHQSFSPNITGWAPEDDL